MHFFLSNKKTRVQSETSLNLVVVGNRLRVKDVLWILYLVINEVTLHLVALWRSSWVETAVSKELRVRQLCSLMCFPLTSRRGEPMKQLQNPFHPTPSNNRVWGGRKGRGLSLVSYTGGVGAWRLLGPLELEFPIGGLTSDFYFGFIALVQFSLYWKRLNTVRSCPVHPGESCWWPGLILEHPESGWNN